MRIIMVIDVYSSSLMIRITKIILLSFIASFYSAIALSPSQPISSKRLLQTSIQNCTLPSVNVTSNIIPIGFCPQQVFIMALSIGIPAQNLYYLVDTGQQFIEVMLNQSNQIGFNLQQSQTVELSGQYGQIYIGDGQKVVDELGSDLVGFSNYTFNTRADILFVDQPVTNLYWQVISGVAGIGFGSSAQNIFQVAKEQSLISTATCIVSLSLTPFSYIYYNELPSQITNQSYFIKSNSHSEYALKIIGLIVGGVDLTSGAPDSAILSTSNNYFYLNQKVYDAVVNKYFSNCTSTSQGPSCPCSEATNWPTFSFMFIGVQAYIPYESYLLYLEDGTCSYGFGYIENENDKMILGTSFFVNYNVTLNPEERKIGLQGNLTPIQVIDFTYFIVLEYVFLFVAISLAIAAAFLVWHLRLIEKDSPTRTIEFSISDRFIETD